MASITVSNNNNSNIIQVNTPGPQGPTGPAGPTGSSLPFSNTSGDIWATTSSIEFSGSVVSIEGFTGSLQGTATTASYLDTLNQNLTFNGNLTLNGTASISGSVNITGSLTTNDGITATSVTAPSLIGTASWASNISNRFWRNGEHGAQFPGGSAQITYSQLIPANTFGVGDIIEIVYKAEKQGTNGTFSIGVYINTAGNISGNAVATLTGTTNTQIYLALSRFGSIKASNTEFLNFAITSSNTDITTSTLAATENTINWAVNNTVVFVVQGSNILDLVKGSMFLIRRI
jgi:hypothetical protein